MKKIQKKILWGLLVCFGLSLFHIGYSSATSFSDEMKETTYRFLQYVEEGRYEAADAVLTKLRRDYSIDDKEYSVVFQDVLNETQQALNDSRVVPEEKYHKSLTLVLLYEATWNKVDPLWLSWKDHLLTEMTNEPLKNKDRLQNVYSLYERLLPAVKVSGTKESVHILESHMKKLHEMQALIDEDLQEEQISVFAQEVKEVEVKRKKSLTEEPGFIWLMGSVGSLISFTLMYVGWRKYKGEKTDDTEKKRERDS
ncbi:sporulation protein YpjB [Pontibacillus salipaludis]|uniref:sporulation protein YpjB n=1 Tax=Pontibacillus salipaludis TaxID=1697394 RepID=UPI0031F0564A